MGFGARAEGNYGARTPSSTQLSKLINARNTNLTSPVSCKRGRATWWLLRDCDMYFVRMYPLSVYLHAVDGLFKLTPPPLLEQVLRYCVTEVGPCVHTIQPSYPTGTSKKKIHCPRGEGGGRWKVWRRRNFYKKINHILSRGRPNQFSSVYEGGKFNGDDKNASPIRRTPVCTKTTWQKKNIDSLLLYSGLLYVAKTQNSKWVWAKVRGWEHTPVPFCWLLLEGVFVITCTPRVIPT